MFIMNEGADSNYSEKYKKYKRRTEDHTDLTK
jgi:hypothetical protein